MYASCNLKLFSLVFLILIVTNGINGSDLYGLENDSHQQVLSPIQEEQSFKVLAFAGPMRRHIGRVISAPDHSSSSSAQQARSYVQDNRFYETYNPAPGNFYTDGSYKGEKIYWFKGKRIYW